MSDISNIDSNFKIETKIKQSDIKFYDVNQPFFRIHGVVYEAGKFRRLPESVAASVSPGVHALHAHTAGGRVRFRTDSSYIAINVKMPSIGKMPHFALTGSAGFDMYIYENTEKYIATFMPPFSMQKGYESIFNFGDSKMRDITINFPLYSEVSQLYIGLRETAEVCAPRQYKIQKPVVYYGSSITQGGCASRPGNSYESIISRRFDCDYINLGFSGNAKAEDSIAEYISKLDMSVFVYDYDHNAPSVQHLENTHEKMFKVIRAANPNLPIVIMSRPKYYLADDEVVRYEVIKSTYDNARKIGDNNVYFVDGRTLMNLAGNEGTVDNCHPNDLGFTSMARSLETILMKIL